jgi:hypothetical protein
MNRPDLGRIPTFLVASGAVALLAPGSIRLLQPSERPEAAASPSPGQGRTHATNAPASGELTAPAAVWAATLRDELFPEPPALPPEAAPPPPLAIELIAISERGGLRTAFVYDASVKEFVEVALGGTLPSGAVLTELAPHAAVFERGEQRTRLELKR